MSRKDQPINGQSSKGASDKTVQAKLWQDSPLAADQLPDPVADSKNSGHAVRRKTIQDVLFGEGLLAVKISFGVNTLAELQDALTKQLGQNSMETRVRYAQSILQWFFPDGLNGLARRV